MASQHDGLGGDRPPALVSWFGQPFRRVPGSHRSVVHARKIDRLEPGASRELLVTVTVGEDIAAGAYHGQLLVDGLADVVFPLHVTVLSTSNPS